MDLAGHRKYLRTTIAGLSGYFPHHAMLVVSSVLGIVGMTREHLAITMALEVPFFVVVTKVDISSPKPILDELEALIQAVGCRKVCQAFSSSSKKPSSFTPAYSFFSFFVAVDVSRAKRRRSHYGLLQPVK